MVTKFRQDWSRNHEVVNKQKNRLRLPACVFSQIIVRLTLLRSPKILTLLVFWGLFRLQIDLECSLFT